MSSSEKKVYYFLDILKLFFACMIPLLHMKYAGGPKLGILQEYIARLGVPFFFAVTGLLLEEKLSACAGDDPSSGWKTGLKFIKRAAFLLIFWAIIDLPAEFFIRSGSPGGSNVIMFIKEVFFMTPGYLWYLGALIIGEALYLLLRVTFRLDIYKVLIITGILYVIGTLGNSWSIVVRIFPNWYEDIFLTTRNGLFFAPFMIAAGALLTKARSLSRGMSFALFLLSAALFAAEVWFIRSRVTGEFDSSMYFSLPLIEFFIVKCGMDINVRGRIRPLCAYLRKLSVLIYCCQYVCLTAGYYLFYFRLPKALYMLAVYAILLPVSVILLIIIEKSHVRWLKKLV